MFTAQSPRHVDSERHRLRSLVRELTGGECSAVLVSVPLGWAQAAVGGLRADPPIEAHEAPVAARHALGVAVQPRDRAVAALAGVVLALYDLHARRPICAVEGAGVRAHGCRDVAPRASAQDHKGTPHNRTAGGSDHEGMAKRGRGDVHSRNDCCNQKFDGAKARRIGGRRADALCTHCETPAPVTGLTQRKKAGERRWAWDSGTPLSCPPTQHTLRCSRT